MKVLGSVRGVLGAVDAHVGVAVPTPAGGVQRRPQRRVEPPPQPRIVPAIAYPDGVAFAIRLGRVVADASAQADAVGVELDAALGIVSATGGGAVEAVGVSQRLETGDALAIGAKAARVAQTVVYVTVPQRRRVDAIDRAWDDLQREEDELLELLGVLE